MSTRKKSPYTINVRDLLGRPGAMHETALDVSAPEHLGEGLAVVAAGARLEADVRLESVHEGVLVTADVQTTAEAECGRCLREMTVPVQVDFQELFAYSSKDADEHTVHDDHVDLEPLIRDAVVLALPFQPVCSPDCPGLDPETGERLEREPVRGDAVGHDPRWAALAGLQASMNEGSDAASDADTHREKR